MLSRHDILDALREFADRGHTVTPALAAAMLDVFSRFDERPSSTLIYRLSEPEREALACTAARWPVEEIACYLRLPVESLDAVLAAGIDKLSRNLDPDDGGFGSGDGEPRPGPHGGPSGRAAANRLLDEDEGPGTWFIPETRVNPADWPDEQR